MLQLLICNNFNQQKAEIKTINTIYKIPLYLPRISGISRGAIVHSGCVWVLFFAKETIKYVSGGFIPRRISHKAAANKQTN